MVYGVCVCACEWCMVYGVCVCVCVWCMVYGVWCMVYGVKQETTRDTVSNAAGPRKLGGNAGQKGRAWRDTAQLGNAPTQKPQLDIFPKGVCYSTVRKKKNR